ncbi:MAG: sterol desaturase family protein [Gammaproteobacteria bacterium]|nr:sterol desaturase family protein [Gammaproteobacteria bacterium]
MVIEIFGFSHELWWEWTGIDYVLNPHKRIFWLFILSSFVIAFLYVLYKKENYNNYFNKSFWFHPSAQLDYQYFILISIIKSLVVFPLMLSVTDTAFYVVQLLNEFLGYHLPFNLNRNAIIFLYTLTLFIIGDFTRYWLHRWFHSSDLLWQFHKVHHSAEVLTPFTFYRVHPIENFLFGLRYALTTGIVTGIFIYCFGARLQVMDVLGVNLFIFLSLILGANLRHSPIYLRYPELVEKWFISPAQHQYHHTPEGARKNYSGVLALWDRLFGSLHVSEEKKLKTFGLLMNENQSNGLSNNNEPSSQSDFNESESYKKLTDLLFKPFNNSFNMMIEKVKL